MQARIAVRFAQDPDGKMRTRKPSAQHRIERISPAAACSAVASAVAGSKCLQIIRRRYAYGVNRASRSQRRPRGAAPAPGWGMPSGCWVPAIAPAMAYDAPVWMLTYVPMSQRQRLYLTRGLPQGGFRVTEAVALFGKQGQPPILVTRL